MINLEIIKNLQEKYRGLRVEDLCEINEEYSCVICGNEKCHLVGTIGNYCCPDAIPATEEQFALRYNFEEK